MCHHPQVILVTCPSIWTVPFSIKFRRLYTGMIYPRALSDCWMFDLPLVHACLHVYRSLEPRAPESEPGFEVNISLVPKRLGTRLRLTYTDANQHSCIMLLLSIDLQQLPNRSLRMMKKYPYPKASNQPPSLSPYQVIMQIFSQSMIHI